jgi:hypothetical protein
MAWASGVVRLGGSFDRDCRRAWRGRVVGGAAGAGAGASLLLVLLGTVMSAGWLRTLGGRASAVATLGGATGG